jgi:hypothetical protein
MLEQERLPWPNRLQQTFEKNTNETILKPLLSISECEWDNQMTVNLISVNVNKALEYRKNCHKVENKDFMKEGKYVREWAMVLLFTLFCSVENSKLYRMNGHSAT